MRGCFKAAMAIGLTLALTAPALAQGRGGMGGGMGGGPGLIGNPSVQKELKLDESQKEKATVVSTMIREKMMAMRSELEGLEGPELMAKRQELAKPINDEAMKKIKEILKAEQTTRFEQIELQQRGLAAFADPAIAKKLSVTDEQSTKVKSLMTDMQSEVREIMQSAGDDRAAAQPKIASLRKETTTKVMALMSDDQKKTWKEMTGEPFEVVQQQRGGR